MLYTCSTSIIGKKDGHEALCNVRKFGLEALYIYTATSSVIGHTQVLCSSCTNNAIMSSTSPSAHRALPDVEAMEELFANTALVDLLTSLPKRSLTQQLNLWMSQKDQRLRTSSLLYSLGRQITATQAKRLDSLGLSHDVLCEIWVSSPSEVFQETLLVRGVCSKKLRERKVYAKH